MQIPPVGRDPPREPDKKQGETTAGQSIDEPVDSYPNQQGMVLGIAIGTGIAAISAMVIYLLVARKRRKKLTWMRYQDTKPVDLVLYQLKG